MSFGKVTQEDNHLKIEYSAPLMGIDTTALPPYIQGLAYSDNCFLRNQTYLPCAWQQLTFGDQGTFDTASLLIGCGELPFPIAISGAINVEDKFFYVTLKGSNVSAFVSDNLGTASGGVGLVAVLGNPVPGTLSWKSINGVTYMSAPGMSQILQIAETAGALALTQLTAAIGCKFLGELNGRLLALNTSTWTTSGGVSFAENSPFQVAWSAGGEQYGIWNVLDMSGNATGAGFNNLPDVEDEITGALFIGPTVYCIRRQGITEITALNSGVEPFNFDHMWASHKGVGTVFPDTISQYGSKGAFLSTTDIFTIGLEGIGVIAGAAKQAIYSTLYNSSAVKGSMGSLVINGEPELCYILAMMLIPNPSTPNVSYIRTFIYGFETQQWMQQTIPNGTTAGSAQNLLQVVSLLQSNLVVSGGSDNISTDAFLLAMQNPGHVPTFWTIPAAPFNNTTIGQNGESRINFPVERIVTWKNVTLDAIGVYATGTPGSILNPTISGVPFTPIVLGTNADPDDPNLYKSYPVSAVACTTHNPQLSLGLNGSIQLGEISMYGTVAQGRGL